MKILAMSLLTLAFSAPVSTHASAAEDGRRCTYDAYGCTYIHVSYDGETVDGAVMQCGDDPNYYEIPSGGIYGECSGEEITF